MTTSPVAKIIVGAGAFAFFVMSCRGLKVGTSMMSAKAFGGCAIGLNILVIPYEANKLRKREEFLDKIEAVTGEKPIAIVVSSALTPVMEMVSALAMVGLGAACIGGAPVFRALAITGVTSYVVTCVVHLPAKQAEGVLVWKEFGEEMAARNA